MAKPRAIRPACAVALVLVMSACGSDESTPSTVSDVVEVSIPAEEAASLGHSSDVVPMEGPPAEEAESPTEGNPVEEETLGIASAEALDRWLASGIVDYDMTVRPDIDEVVFDVDVADAYEIEVRGGLIARVIPDDVFSSSLDDFLPPAVFAEMAGAISDGKEIVIFDDPTSPFIARTEQTFESGYVATVEFRRFRQPSDYPEQCSTAGLNIEMSPEGLPPAVLETRARLVGAATECDFLALAAIASEGDGFVETSFGGSGVELIWQQEARGEPLLKTMVDLLREPPVLNDEYAIWPADFPEAEGDYFDWRLTIDVHGDWKFFIAGD